MGEIVACAVRRTNLLGEGPCWDAAADRLWWVDILSRRLEWLEPSSGDSGGFELDVRASAVAPRREGALLMASDAGFGVFSPATGTLELRLHPEPERHWNRSNDGKTDALGRFWLGTMDADGGARNSGAVYRLDADWTATRVADGLGIPNTLTHSRDGRTLYLADSRERTLHACDVEADGELGAWRTFASTIGEAGTPDGSALDTEGFLWNAQWGGWRLVRYAPDGSIDRIVPMPVEQPSSCAFGGPGLETLYVTTARAGLSAHALADQPLAGSLLSFRPGVAGHPLAPFAD